MPCDVRKLFAAGILCGLLTAAVCAEPTYAGQTTVQTITVGTRHNIEARLYTPDGPGLYPSVLVLGTSSGVAAADQTYARRLADQGFITIVPKYLEAYGISEAQRRKSFTAEAPAITADFMHILGELDKLPTAMAGANGVVGFSNGGFFALILASMGKVKAGISYYGALDGARSYPQLEPFQRRFGSGSAPVLVLAGDEDQTIRMESVNRLAEILKSAGAPHEVKIYAGAGHGFERSTAAPSNGSAANDAWKRTLAFLNANLR